MKRPEGMKPKDLCLIPWRLAIALQQPWEADCIVRRDVDRAWLAAMFDGEGCISIRRHDSHRRSRGQKYQDGFIPFVCITNNDVPLLDRCVDLTGLGKPRLKQSAGDTDGRGIVSRRDSYGWRVESNQAIDVVRAIYPYLIAKRKQACLAYTLDVLNKSGREVRGNGPVPTELQEKRRLCWEIIKKCNQREPVDLPSWVEEPKPKIEPGWWVRSVIVWAKKSCMPESVTDRPTNSWEPIFLLAKSAKYFMDMEAVKELAESEPHNPGNKTVTQPKDKGSRDPAYAPGRTCGNGTRNQRNVWHLGPEPFSEAHFATFPTEIPRRAIKAGSKVGNLVLDPFCGSGTTGLVARQLGRRFVGIELNPEYAEMARRRITSDAPLLETSAEIVEAEIPRQDSMF